MLVEDPRDTIRALCEISNIPINWHSYKETYEKTKGLAEPISSQHNDTHFYSLSIYGILKPSESGIKGEYQISSIGQALCQSLEDNRIDDYRKILSSILINNRAKGRIFRDFINFVKVRGMTSYEQIPKYIKKKYGKNKKDSTIGIMARTLMAWSEEAGLIGRDKEREIVWVIGQKPRQELTIQQFWGQLVKKYKQLRKSEIFGMENIYVDILELRTIMCAELSLSIEDFDSLLVRLLDSEEYSERIRLYGAPTSFFADKENFRYKDRVYAYIMIKV
jgi:hypothetical protein